jgi:hypothetical protein
MSNYFELNAGCPREYLPTDGKYFADYTPIVALLPVGRLKLGVTHYEQANNQIKEHFGVKE